MDTIILHKIRFRYLVEFHLEELSLKCIERLRKNSSMLIAYDSRNFVLKTRLHVKYIKRLGRYSRSVQARRDEIGESWEEKEGSGDGEFDIEDA